jgi:hypothetical protein
MPSIAFSALGVSNLPLPELPLQQIADAFLEAGNAAARAVAEHLRRGMRESSPLRPAAPSKAPEESTLPRTPPERDQQRTAEAIPAEAVDAVFLLTLPDTDFSPAQGLVRLPLAAEHGEADTESTLRRLDTDTGNEDSDRSVLALGTVFWLLGAAGNEVRRNRSGRWGRTGWQPFLRGR